MEGETLSACAYTLHLPPTSSSLQPFLPSLKAFLSTLSAPYIFHHPTPFANLSLSPLAFSASAQQYRWIEGTTDCADAVDDEWFLVWLLREVTRVWEDVVVGVADEDGEFLLIEGAEELPRWVTPGNAENRVWIYREQLHLVPIEYTSALPFASADSSATPTHGADEGFIDRLQALALVRDPNVNTLAPPALQEIVWARINGYPGKIEEHHHKTISYLPRDVALALSDSPGLVAEAIGAFYARDPDGLRACNQMKRFPPSSPSDALLPLPATTDDAAQPATVKVLSTLTRPLYSQLVLQRFFSPKPFEKVGWMNGGDGTKLTDEDERRRSVGMKITCGFEILYAQTASQLRVATGSSEPATVDTASAAYKAFLARLSNAGYFGDEIQGSKVWSEREKVAREGWAKGVATGGDGSTKSFAQRVDEAIARRKALPLASQLPNLVGRQSPGADLALESSEDWLIVDEEGLEDMLRRRGPGAGGLGESDLEDDSDEEDEDGGEGMEGVEGEGTGDMMEKKERRKTERVAKKLEGMAGKVEEFIHGRGAVEGAEFSDEQSDDDDDSDDEELPTLSPEERAARLAQLVPSLPLSEWGQDSSAPPTTEPPVVPTSAPTNTTLPARPPKLTSNKYDGASSDESSDEDAQVEGEEGLGEDEGEDAPAVMEDMDMEEEMDEFLKFATETLGLSAEQYSKILGERKSRGAFVPPPSKAKKTNVGPPPPRSAPAPQAAAALPPPPPAAPRVPLRNPNLTDFDALMEQMDAELARSRAGQPAPAASTSSSSSARPKPKFTKPTPKPTPTSSTKKGASSNIVVDSDVSDDEMMGEMDAELAELFKTVGGQGGREDAPGGGGPVDYNLVKNFLESFQSQGGFAGPAGNLSGRLGFQLPRDETG